MQRRRYSSPRVRVLRCPRSSAQAQSTLPTSWTEDSTTSFPISRRDTKPRSPEVCLHSVVVLHVVCLSTSRSSDVFPPPSLTRPLPRRAPHTVALGEPRAYVIGMRGSAHPVPAARRRRMQERLHQSQAPRPPRRRRVPRLGSARPWPGLEPQRARDRGRRPRGWRVAGAAGSEQNAAWATATATA